MRERKPLKDPALGSEKAVRCLGKRGRHKAEGGQQLPSVPWNQGGRTQGSWQHGKKKPLGEELPTSLPSLGLGMSHAKAGNVRGRERATVKYHITRTALMLFYATVIRIFLWSEHLSSISVVFRSSGWENGRINRWSPGNF